VTIATQDREALGTRGLPDGIEHGVYSPSRRGIPDSVEHARSVGEGSGAEGADDLLLSGGGRTAEDPDPAPLEKLHEQCSHASRGCVDDGGLPWCQRRRHVSQPIGREALGG
jgi:hypothetical protein